MGSGILAVGDDRQAAGEEDEGEHELDDGTESLSK